MNTSPEWSQTLAKSLAFFEKHKNLTPRQRVRKAIRQGLLDENTAQIILKMAKNFDGEDS